ncbi:MAG: hypothetical protein M0Z63_06280 [Actinomycetota bacterium]|jgi:hypothetical protein|nr:hypothetical protein [Actinomycetota bacterium]
MRPTAEELLASLRLSLNDTVAPKVEDRWARYVVSAMDLVLAHLQLRMAGELDAMDADNVDMSATLVSLAGLAVRHGEHGGEARDRWAAVLERIGSPEPGGPGQRLDDAVARNEELRGRIVAVLQWLDETDPGDEDPQLRGVRDELHRLVRRQVDRLVPLVEPLYMSFRPVGA